jgi:hypothetical protein
VGKYGTAAPVDVGLERERGGTATLKMPSNNATCMSAAVQQMLLLPCMRCALEHAEARGQERCSVSYLLRCPVPHPHIVCFVCKGYPGLHRVKLY